MKRPYKILIIIVSAIAVTVLVLVANISRSRMQVRGVEADIRYGGAPSLVGAQTVVDTVVAVMPGLRQTTVGAVDRRAVSDAASRVPYLTDVKTTVSVSGRVTIHASQRKPIARLFYGSRQFYIDDEAALMPVSTLGHCSVLVLSGDFDEPLRPDSLNSQVLALYTVASWLQSHRQYNGLIDQLYIQRDGDILMVPKVGDHIVELGPATDLDSKFSRLLAFYRKGMPRAGWQAYSKISLKYEGQVVCTKANK